MCERLTILVEQVPYTKGEMWSGTAMWGFAVSSTLPAYQRQHGVEQGLVMFRAWWRRRCVKGGKAGGKVDVSDRHRRTAVWQQRCRALGYNPEKASKWEIAGATDVSAEHRKSEGWIERCFALEYDPEKASKWEIAGATCQELRRELRLEKAMLEAKKGRASAAVGETAEWTDDEEAPLLELTKIVDTLLYGDGKGKTGVAGGSQRIVDRLSGAIVAALETGDEAAAERLTEELKRQQAHLAARVAAGIASIESGRGTNRNPLPTTDREKVLRWVWDNVYFPYFRGEELNTLLEGMEMNGEQVQKLITNSIMRLKINDMNHKVCVVSDLKRGQRQRGEIELPGGPC